MGVHSNRPLKVLLNDVLQMQSSSNQLAAIAKLLEEVKSISSQNAEGKDKDGEDGAGAG